jgi:hypothetical protein
VATSSSCDQAATKTISTSAQVQISKSTDRGGITTAPTASNECTTNPVNVSSGGRMGVTQALRKGTGARTGRNRSVLEHEHRVLGPFLKLNRQRE